MKNNKNKSLVFFIILILIFSFILYKSMQYKNTFNQEQENKTIGKLDNQTVFENKQKCATYKEEINKKMGETEWTKYIIEDIFYSEQENSCLFSVIGYQEKSALLGESYVAYMIWDYLSDNLIFYRDSTVTDGLDIADLYKNAVEYLQGKDTLKYKRSQWNYN